MNRHVNSTGETVRAIKAEMAEIEAGLARIDRLATDDIRKMVPADALDAVEKAHARAVGAAHVLHRQLHKASAQSGTPAVRSGGDGK